MHRWYQCFILDRWTSPKADGHHIITDIFFSVLSLCPQPAAWTQIKKRNTDSTDFTRIGLSRIFFWCYLANDSWILVWILQDLQVLGHFLFSICFAMHNCYRMFPSANKYQPPLVLKPILTFPKGRNKLLCQWASVPSRSPPKGRCRLLWPLIKHRQSGSLSYPDSQWYPNG